ncbi:MAG TPA: hypothetical protein VJN70_14560 [Gemmatimonadaceae bacterium]|nr:hypothetical protein [Gemmatimonadaceae bacterium]
MSANDQIHAADETVESVTELHFEELEERIAPLVVIAIIAILIGLLLPDPPTRVPLE